MGNPNCNFQCTAYKCNCEDSGSGTQHELTKSVNCPTCKPTDKNKRKS
ncbi:MULTISPECIES: hypothetical protein [unclassified Spiroplasma]